MQAGRSKQGCRDCNKLLATVRLSMPSGLFPSNNSDSANSKSGHRADAKHRRRGDDVNGVQPKANFTSTFLVESDRDITANPTPSAKTLITKSILLDWSKRYPEEKIIGESLPPKSGVRSHIACYLTRYDGSVHHVRS